MVPSIAVRASHESGHWTQAIHERVIVFKVVTDPYDRAGTHGYTEFLHPDDPEVLARIAIAGRYGEPETTFEQSASDDRRVKEIWASIGSPPGWVEKREAEVFVFWQRKSTIKASQIAAAFLVESPGGSLEGLALSRAELAIGVALDG